MYNMIYTVVLDFDQEEHVYNASVPALPGCFAWGKTRTQAVSRIKEVIITYIDALADLGESIPEEVDLERVKIS
jgi:predicted RNase H-like HicB family nuclease